jgi:opacity protein-like surface antigen
MKKFAYIFVAIALLSLAGGCAAYAQQMSLGINGEVALPMGTFGDVSGVGFGGTALFGYQIDPNITLTGRVGYLSFSEKEDGFPTYSVMPILVGGRYYFMPEGEDMRMYGAAELGLYNVAWKWSFMGMDFDDSEMKFGFAPAVGAQFKVGDNMNLDAHLNYSYISTEGDAINWLGIGIGLEFGL